MNKAITKYVPCIHAGDGGFVMSPLQFEKQERQPEISLELQYLVAMMKLIQVQEA